MRRFCLTSILLGFSVCALSAQNRALKEVVVTEHRPMSEIGVQMTVFDSTELKENVALSMADVLTYNSSVFVKNYGRATMSTVAFRGTSPSHTQVTWNGMRINSPMVGMTDFSTIPAYFIDKASLLHGTSSVSESGGGLGGAVRLSTVAGSDEGLDMNYVQGIGSFSTFDEYLGVRYGCKHWQTSTRLVYSSSPNDYKYVNHDKKLNIYDENHIIIGQYHPTERNRSGAFKDFHALQEIHYDNFKGDRCSLSAWYVNSKRELPLLTTDYTEEREFENKQREQTLRMVAAWNHSRELWKTAVRAGYIHTELAYDYRRELYDGYWTTMTQSRSNVNTVYGSLNGDYSPTSCLYFSGELSAHQHLVKSHDKNVIMQDGEHAIIGYDKARIELSALFSAKWQPTGRIGLSAALRKESFGDRTAPLIPAFFIDGLVSRKGNITLKSSVSKNYRFPSLNDLYFLPGGNPNLKNEHGFSYDAGMEFYVSKKDRLSIAGGATWFDSRIKDWIIWLPTPKGFFSPRNIMKVHAYGVELNGKLDWALSKDWNLNINGNASWSPSINVGDKLSDGDRSVGKQLPYIPRYSSSVVGRLGWRSWSFIYKWCYYSERYTMSSNDVSLSGRLPSYFMNNISLEKSLNLSFADLQLKLAVNNLFNEEYMSVLSRPMPGINFEFFISITPRF